MKIYLFIVFLAFYAFITNAQVVDNFTDGDFTTNPGWTGSTSQFIVNASKQLQLNNTVAGSSYLSTPFVINSLNGFEWQAYVKQIFAPSGSNYGRIYLASSQQNLNGQLNGYYLQFGEAGSNDAVELFKQTGSASTSICRATAGKIANSFEVRVRVTRDNAGVWNIYADYTGGSNFTLEATGSDVTYVTAQAFGVACVYTTSNSTKFYYDDLFAGPIQVDTTPPTVTSVTVISANQLSVLFSENLDQSSAETILNYVVDNAIGNATQAKLQSDGKTVLLSFNAFANGLQNQLTVVGIKDLIGNAITLANFSFIYFNPVSEKRYDVVVSEILPDPDPVIGLPAAEFIEIYNKSSSPFDLNGWKLTDGISTATFSSQIILPNTYWIVTSSTNASLFSAYKNVIGLTNFPSFNNSGDLVLLKSNSGSIIDSLNYSTSWYRDADKQQGGWSLEKIDLNTSSTDGLNWVASQDATGGTPGKQNSWFGKNPDITPPKLLSLTVKNDSQLELIFDEALDATSITKSNFNVNNSIGNPSSAQLSTDAKTISLSFESKFKNGIENAITLENISDLAGNKSEKVTQFFTYILDSNSFNKDVIITEIFADPTPSLGLPEAEYIEVYNRSASPFDLVGWNVQVGKSTTAFTNQIILPGQYLIITNSKYASKLNTFGRVLGLPNFPVLPNDGATLLLKNNQGKVIDSLNYSPTWYRSSDKSEGGWSLELIDPNNPCGEEDNWTASESLIGGTPGKQNSVFANKPDSTGPKLTSVLPLNENQLLLSFDEKLDQTSLNQNNVLLTPSVAIGKIYFTDVSKRQIKLDLQQPLQKRQLYILKLQRIYDCADNTIQEHFSELTFALPEEAAPGEVVINELLFNPKPDGVDFLEVYNNSSKYVSIGEWKLANIANGVLTNLQPMSTPTNILQPNQYRVFTVDPAILKSNYVLGDEKNFAKTTLPSLPDDAGSIALIGKTGMVIDSFFYTNNFHSTFVKDEEGVSLERISFSQKTNDPANWKSASSQSGFGTPGYANSNARPVESVLDEKIKIDPEIIIPNSGQQDFAKINYEFDQSNFIANIKILDQQGRIIKTIANNETLGYSGFFRWDGNKEDGTKARIGYYIVWIDLFDDTGNVNTFRKRIVVAGL